MKFYDERSRLVQEKSTNHLGGFDKTYFAYSFVDKPIKMQHIHSASGKATQTEIYAYEYDHAGRLLITKHKLNAGTETLLVSNSYDKLGRLKSNSRTGSNPNLKTDYTYNVRSWMKTISNPLFNETLYYQDALKNVSGYTPNYNGNISAMNWKTNDKKDRTYVLNYDNLSRLTSDTYSQMGNPLANYSESSSYDPHGNVTAIQRFGRTGTGTFGLIDNLAMNYNGNQLVKAEDAISTSNFSDQGDFRNGVSKTVEYEYDKNGNMTKDFNKGISSISYNSLNLPVSLSIANDLGSATNNYTYSADGKKLKVEMKFGNQTMTTDYVDNMIYENGGLKRILVDGGYIENNKYHFFIQDHLGNNRAVAQADGTVIQTNHYYPYGMTFTEDNIGDPKAQPYKYGGKEFDGERGLNFYDFLARSVDAVEGRFTGVDPLCEKYYSISPYVYCANNPVRFIDPDGREIDIEHRTGFLGLGKKEILKYDNGNLYNKDGSAYTGKVNGFLKKTVNALGSLNQTKEGGSMVTELQSSFNVFTIKSGSTNEFKFDSPLKAGANLTEFQSVTGNTAGSTGSGGTIFWNSSSTNGGFDLSRGTTRPAYISLGHEMGHGSDSNQGLLHFSSSYTNGVTGAQYQSTYQGLLKSEWRAVYRENLIRGQAGVPLRTNYGIDMSTGVSLPAGPRLLDSSNQPLNYP